MTKLKVGVIGLGAFAKLARLPVLALRDDVELTACMARDAATAEEVGRRFGFQRTYTALEHLIADSGIEAAFVVTPKEAHHKIVLALLRRGIHVFCEKPMATSLPMAEEMVKTAADQGKVLMIGFNRRFAPVYELARAEFRAAAPEACLAVKNRPGTELRATLENAIHMVDLLRWFCGECVHVEARARFEDPFYETTTAAMLTFDSGATGILLANRSCGQWEERLEMHGAGKSVLVSMPDQVTVVDHEQEHARRMTPLRMGWAGLQEKFGFEREVAHFLDCVRSGREPLTSGRDSLKTHILMHEILCSAGLPGLE